MASHKPQIILASASPRRELLLREMGLRFRVLAPDGVEELATGATPEVLSLQNAQLKARAVAGHHPESLVIGADTIVVLDGNVYGKPRDLADAGRMLAELAGRQHTVITGVCLIRRSTGTELTFAEHTKVWMRALDAGQIADYHKKVNPLDKAGAYGAQEFGASIIERIEGSFANVMGLPVERLQGALERLGF